MPLDNWKVLVINDEELNLEIIDEYLTEANYTVVKAAGGKRAWQILCEAKSDEFAVILLDKMMPDLDGISLLKKIKRERRYKGLPIILQTAAANRQEVLEGLEAGAYYYLTKPFQKEMLLSIVRTAVLDWFNYQELKFQLQSEMDSTKLMNSGKFTIRTLAESKKLASFLANACPESEKVVVGLSELLVNAIEHGNLGINYEEKSALIKSGTWVEEIERRLLLDENKEKLVTVEFIRNTSEIIINIEDEGDGFDWEKYKTIEPQRATDGHGRGIAMANLISFDKLEYKKQGSELSCYIDLNKDKAE